MTNPYESPRTSTEKMPSAGTLSVRSLFIGLALIVGGWLLLALLFRSTRGSPEISRRVQCINNLKQIGLALHNYHDEYHSLPPPFTVDTEGKPLHSWRTLILPFMEEKELYDSIDLSKPWDDPINAEAAKMMPRCYRCPSINRATNRTNYLAIVGPNACFTPGQCHTFDEITDRYANTLMVVEVSAEYDVPWMAPEDLEEQRIITLPEICKQVHSGGFQASRVDGSVRFLSQTTNTQALRAMATIAGGDDDDISSDD